MMMDFKNFHRSLSPEDIRAVVKGLGERLNKDYAGEKVLLVCVLKGAYVFAADLIRELQFENDIEFVRLSSYGKARNSSGTVTLIKDIQSDIRDRHVVIIEEIIDSGRTLRFLYDRLMQSKPKSVEICTLLDKKSKRVVDVPVKYVGKEVEDQFLVGYGLDLEESARNLPDIFYLRYPN